MSETLTLQFGKCSTAACVACPRSSSARWRCWWRNWRYRSFR